VATFPNFHPEIVARQGIVPLAREIAQLSQPLGESLAFPPDKVTPEGAPGTEAAAPGSAHQVAPEHAVPSLSRENAPHYVPAISALAAAPGAVGALTALTGRHPAPNLQPAISALTASSGHAGGPVIPPAPAMELRQPPAAQSPAPHKAPEAGNFWRGQITPPGDFITPPGMEMDPFTGGIQEFAASPTPAPSPAAASQPGIPPAFRAGQNSPVDVQSLARQVYKILQSELRNERERRQLYSR
jgi:hypothetical protein